MTFLDSLQTALAAEHAAVYLYGALGAQTSQSAEPGLFLAVSEAYAAHRAARDRLVARVTDLDAAPIAAEAVYELPTDLSTTALVARRALELERSCATTYAFLVANSPSKERQFAITALTQT
ncbi:MAG: ferritin-like domain-containing protein, partial [Actinomycetota bacterium]|nr:ferritin-like domain-containing protein [Actinomycetota bacterium]